MTRPFTLSAPTILRAPFGFWNGGGNSQSDAATGDPLASATSGATEPAPTNPTAQPQAGNPLDAAATTTGNPLATLGRTEPPVSAPAPATASPVPETTNASTASSSVSGILARLAEVRSADATAQQQAESAESMGLALMQAVVENGQVAQDPFQSFQPIPDEVITQLSALTFDKNMDLAAIAAQMADPETAPAALATLVNDVARTVLQNASALINVGARRAAEQAISTTQATSEQTAVESRVLTTLQNTYPDRIGAHNIAHVRALVKTIVPQANSEGDAVAGVTALLALASPNPAATGANTRGVKTDFASLFN